MNSTLRQVADQYAASGQKAEIVGDYVLVTDNTGHNSYLVDVNGRVLTLRYIATKLSGHTPVAIDTHLD